MKNLIIVLVICLGSIVSYGQIDTVQNDSKLILYGNFIGVDNVKCWIYKVNESNEWELSDVIKYFKKYYITIDTCSNTFIFFDNGVIEKELCVYPIIPGYREINIDFSINIGIPKFLIYNDITNIYELLIKEQLTWNPE